MYICDNIHYNIHYDTYIYIYIYIYTHITCVYIYIYIYIYVLCCGLGGLRTALSDGPRRAPPLQGRLVNSYTHNTTNKY